MMKTPAGSITVENPALTTSEMQAQSVAMMIKMSGQSTRPALLAKSMIRSGTKATSKYILWGIRRTGPTGIKIGTSRLKTKRRTSQTLKPETGTECSLGADLGRLMPLSAMNAWSVMPICLPVHSYAPDIMIQEAQIHTAQKILHRMRQKQGNKANGRESESARDISAQIVDN